ncbi:linear amide C-N hydrolase [Listeria aquatica]|nr:linear amide C-N hydrolase [Listeria aquatica]
MCTSITLQSKEGNMYWSRTLDETFEETVEVKMFPKNYPVQGKEETFTSKFSFMGVGVSFSNALADGINEEGLVGGLLVLKEASWAARDEILAEGKKPMYGEEIVTWILSQCGTVDEIEEAVKEIVLVDEDYVEGAHFPLHYCFTDRNQEHVVLQPTEKGRFKVYRNAIGILTNSPEYHFHISNLRNYMHLSGYDRNEPNEIRGEIVKQIGSGSGLLGLPGDYTSPSRFVKAAYLSEFVDKPSDSEAIMTLYRVARSVAIAPGWEKIDETGESDRNIYWSGYDQNERAIYIQPARTNTFSKVTLDPSKTTPTSYEVSYNPSIFESAERVPNAHTIEIEREKFGKDISNKVFN